MVHQLEEEVWSLLISRLLNQQDVLFMKPVCLRHQLVPVQVFGDLAVFGLLPKIELNAFPSILYH